MRTPPEADTRDEKGQYFSKGKCRHFLSNFISNVCSGVRIKPIQILLSVVSGLLLFISFPKINMGWAAWIALVPLFIAVRNTDAITSFLYGFIATFVSSLGIYYWVIVAIKADGQSMVLGMLSLCALSAYISLYGGLFSLVFSMTHNRPERPFRMIVAGACWVSLELIRTYAFSGFPWMLLGYSQWRFLPFIQLSRWGGVYIISFFIIIGNIHVYRVWQGGYSSLKRSLSSLVVFALVIGGLCLFGYRSNLHDESRVGDSLTFDFALLQGNIDQYRKWDDRYESDIRTAFTRLSQEASRTHPDIMIWPETGFPGFFEETRTRKWLDALIRETKTFHLVGAASVQNDLLYNSIFLMRPDATVSGRYDKKHLVLFGEKVPFSKVLGRWIPVLNELGGFSEGTTPPVIPWTKGALGSTICFESIFPSLVRKSVQEGARVLVNITNDAWFLRSSAAYQHLVMNVFRAVENHRTVLRCANTGFSAHILPGGRIYAQTGLFETTVLSGTARLSTETTFYTQWGDVFAFLCMALFIGHAVMYIVRRRKRKQKFFDNTS